MNARPSTEERIWVVLAHLSALAFGMGLILPIVGWSEQRRKSNYAAFQCLQALGYQSLGFTVWILGFLLVMILLPLLLIMVVAMAEGGNDRLAAFSIIGFYVFIFLFIFAGLGVYFLLPVIAGVSCALGRDFRYPVMGRRLAGYLEYDPEVEGWLNENHEDRWVAAMGHFSVIISMFGMLAPLTAWIMQGKRSLFLKIQSIQAVVFQTIVLLLSYGAGAIYMFGIFVFVLVIGLGENSAADSSTAMAGLVVLVVSALVAALIALLVPLFHIMGQWAGYRVLKGDNYFYPVMGKLIATRFEANIPTSSLAEEVQQ